MTTRRITPPLAAARRKRVALAGHFVPVLEFVPVTMTTRTLWNDMWLAIQDDITNAINCMAEQVGQQLSA